VTSYSLQDLAAIIPMLHLEVGEDNLVNKELSDQLYKLCYYPLSSPIFRQSNPLTEDLLTQFRQKLTDLSQATAQGGFLYSARDYVLREKVMQYLVFEPEKMHLEDREFWQLVLQIELLMDYEQFHQFVKEGQVQPELIEWLHTKGTDYDEKIKQYLTEEVIGLMKPEDHEYWRFWLKSSDEMRKYILSKRDVVENYVKNGSATVSMLEDLSNSKNLQLLDEIVLDDTVLVQLDTDRRDFWVLWRSISSTQVKEYLIDKSKEITVDQVKTYIEITEKIENSPSVELRRIKDEVLNLVLNSSNPVGTFEAIESVYIRNNLPTVGKVYQIFDLLHSDNKLEEVLKGPFLSPILRHSSPRARKYQIYKDLLNVHIRSGNRSLLGYFELLSKGERVLLKFENEGLDQLSRKEQKLLTNFVDKLTVLYSSSLLSKVNQTEESQKPEDLKGKIAVLKTQYKVQSGESLTQRLSAMYLRPLGLHSFEEVVALAQSVKTDAHIRGIQYSQRFIDGDIEFESGDLIKGVDHQYLDKILQNGSVAKEYLGSSASSDMTPLDTDLSIVLPLDIEAQEKKENFQNAIAKSLGGNGGYGNLLFIVKNRGQLQLTSDDNWKSESQAYELFYSGSPGTRHCGIRTGFPCTEVDYMVALDLLVSDKRSLNKVFYNIAQNGYYIPVVNKKGELIFTPEMYGNLRRSFAGISEYEGEPITITKIQAGVAEYQELQELKQSVLTEKKRIESINEDIQARVSEIIISEGMVFRDELTMGIIGVDLENIGSTGRYTNLEGDSDFDLTMSLDQGDFDKLDSIITKLLIQFSPKTYDMYTRENGSRQLRMKGCLINGEEIEIDIGFASKSDIKPLASHDAIVQKLNSIRETYGEDTYLDIIANIVLAKKRLKQVHAYKKADEGGLGGIGVENWILLNGGNFRQACLSFWNAAHEDGRQLSFSEFKERYKIWDAGMNILYMDYDEYVSRNLKEGGYLKMLSMMGDLLADK